MHNISLRLLLIQQLKVVKNRDNPCKQNVKHPRSSSVEQMQSYPRLKQDDNYFRSE